jgi:hypothetical protein
MAGLLCGVLVFFVAVPLALSSPFPVPNQREWVSEASSYQLASLAPVPVTIDAGPAPEPEFKTASLGPLGLGVPATVEATPAPVFAPEPRPAETEEPETVGSIPPAAPEANPVPTPPRKPAVPVVDLVDEYLWAVYQRAPVKKDSTGDFTWKDPAAAKHMGKSLKAYVIGGMDRDFREQLYHAGRAMDAAGLRWSMLSAFRDDYRQRLAAGFKARPGNSLHGGSRATGGYGHGRAIDVTSADGNGDAVWHWLDRNGAKYGLIRPMPGADPAHIQPRGNWHSIAVALRSSRLHVAEDAAAKTARPKAKLAARTAR